MFVNEQLEQVVLRDISVGLLYVNEFMIFNQNFGFGYKCDGFYEFNFNGGFFVLMFVLSQNFIFVVVIGLFCIVFIYLDQFNFNVKIELSDFV